MRAADLIGEGTAKQDRRVSKATALLNLVLGSKVHTMKPGSTTTKAAWIKLYETAHSSDAITPGPLACHKKHTGKNYQNKLKDLVLQVANHYADCREAKRALYDDDAANDMYTPCEVLGYRITQEKTEADNDRAESKANKEAAARRDQREKESAEAFVGAVSPGRGVNAPSGVVLDDDDQEGLDALGLQPKSHTGESSSCLYILILIHII